MAEFKKNSPNRALIMSIDELQEKIPDVKITGPKENIFTIACRISSEEQRFYRSLDVHKVIGGGVIIQSSWYENGNNAISMSYQPELDIKDVEYTNSDGERCKGQVLTRRKTDRFAFWKWIARAVLGV